MNGSKTSLGQVLIGHRAPELLSVYASQGKRVVIFALVLTLLVVQFSCLAQTPDFKAGVARVDVTPNEPVFLGGYAARTNVSKGVAQRIFVKALALQDATGATTLLITADTIGTPRWFNDQLAERINKELKIPRERFLFACSHSHSTPAIKGALDGAYAMSAQAAEAEQRYSTEFLQKSFAAARTACTALEPAQLAFGRGEAQFATNRRQFGKSDVFIGVNPNGVVDHDVPVLRVQNLDGSIKAILFGYACHCTTLGPNDEISPDWAGYAQQCLEQAYPGATALFITGCGADANPNPRGKMMYVTQHGLELAGVVAQTLNKAMLPLNGPIRAAFDRVNLAFGPLPPKGEFEAKLTNSIPAVVRFAQRFLAMMQRGENLPTNYPCP